MEFIHLNKPKLTRLKTQEKNGKRYYILPGGQLVPSVTTVLGFKKEKDLKKWVEREGKEKTDKIKNKAASRGTDFHTIIELYLKNNPKYNIGCKPDSLEMFFSIKPFLDTIQNIWYMEETLYSTQLGLAGRVDLIGQLNNNVAIIDFKTARSPRKIEYIETYFMQTAAYSAFLYELTGTLAKDAYIIIAVENNSPQIYHIKTFDYMKPLLKCIREYKEYYGEI